MQQPQHTLPLPTLSEDRQRTFENGLVVNIARGGQLTGGDVWKGAHCMQRFLASNAALVAGKRVCELGSGTGYLAMSVHLLGASLSLATDRGSVLKLALDNVQQNAALLKAANGVGEVACCSLDWSEVQESGALPGNEQLRSRLPFDLIVAADCLYYHKDRARALLATLLRLLSECPGADVLLCQSYRGAPDVERIFFDEASASGLHATLLSQDAAFSPDRMELGQMDVCVWRLGREAKPPLGRSPQPSQPPQPPQPPPVEAPVPAPALTPGLSSLIELRRCRGRTEWAFAASPWWEVCPILGKGLGLVAAYDLCRGDRILAERPLVQWHVATDRQGRADLGELDRLVSQLPDAGRRAFFGLCDVHGSSLAFDQTSGRIRTAALGSGDAEGAEQAGASAEVAAAAVAAEAAEVGKGEGEGEKSVAGIWASNAFALDPGDCFTPCDEGHVTHAGVFPTISRLNHSCRPCTFAAWNPKEGVQTVHALRDIRAGTELTHSYLGGGACDGRREPRRAELSRKYRFDCDCEACGYTDDALAQSEQRVVRMAELRRRLLTSDGAGGVLDSVEELWSLGAREGLPAVWQRALVIEAMQAARALGKQAEADALAWARRGAQSAREALGADSPTTIKFEAIVKAWAHALAMGQPLPG